MACKENITSLRTRCNLQASTGYDGIKNGLRQISGKVGSSWKQIR
jgi:hypothetical protein